MGFYSDETILEAHGIFFMSVLFGNGFEVMHVIMLCMKKVFSLVFST